MADDIADRTKGVATDWIVSALGSRVESRWVKSKTEVPFMKAEHQRARVGSDRIGPDDPRYSALVGRGFNKRFAGQPDYVRLVHSTDEVIDAVQDAVREGRRVVARGGGHCLEGFVDDRRSK
jgi:hypothetical protein